MPEPCILQDLVGFGKPKQCIFQCFCALIRPKPCILQGFVALRSQTQTFSKVLLPCETPNLEFLHRKERFRLLQPLERSYSLISTKPFPPPLGLPPNNSNQAISHQLSAIKPISQPSAVSCKAKANCQPSAVSCKAKANWQLIKPILAADKAKTVYFPISHVFLGSDKAKTIFLMFLGFDRAKTM